MAVSPLTGFSLAVLTALPVSAAEVEFRPALTIGAYYDGNVQVTGTPTSNGDGVAAVAAELTVERTAPDSTLHFSYNPAYVAYRNESDLNYFGQSADLLYTHSSSRTASYTIDVNASRTERQGVRTSTASDATTFVQRNMETHFGMNVNGTQRGRRNLVDWGVSGTFVEYSLASLENSIGLSALGSWRYEISEKSSLGLGLTVQAIDYETLDRSYVEAFGLVGTYEFGRLTTMSYAAGVTRTGSTGSSDASFAGNVTIARTITDVSSLSAGVRQSASLGSGVGGTTLDLGGYVSYSHVRPRRGLSGDVTVGYWTREPIAGSTSPPTDTISADALLGWNFNRYLSVNLAYAFSDQSSTDPALETPAYSSYGLNLRWAIRGR